MKFRNIFNDNELQDLHQTARTLLRDEPLVACGLSKLYAMKNVILKLVCAAAIALVASTQAAVINVTEMVTGNNDIPAQSISDYTGNNGLGDQNVLDLIKAFAEEAELPDPTENKSDYVNGSALVAGDYLALHYGSGPGGSQAGGLVILFIDADMPGGITIPADGSGPNGFGGLSFARLYDHVGENVPDGGATVLLLGMGVLGLAFGRKARK